MREILFRGKRVDNGEWVEGYFLEKYSTFWGKIMPFIKIATKSKNVLAAIIVKRETVGQYTGLTDKNGKKIFEGDIVKENNVVYKEEIQIKAKCATVSFKKGCWVILSSGTGTFYKQTQRLSRSSATSTIVLSY